jgi:glycerophosphoryl diester phosphodiesterase
MTEPFVRPDQPLVVAHRGQSAEVPEQTLASFQAAIDRGAEMIEADAQLSRDGRLVLMHDVTVDRTTDGTGHVAEMVWQVLSQLDAGGWFDPRFSGLRIPLVDDLISLASSAGIAICLEAKGATTLETTRVAVALAKLVAERGALSWAFVSSFDHAALAEARRAVPELLIAPERLPERGPLAAEEALGQVAALGAQVLQHRWELLTAELVDLLHRERIAVWAWNTNDLRSIRAALGLGVDGLMGDDAGLLVAARSRLLPR